MGYYQGDFYEAGDFYMAGGKLALAKKALGKLTKSPVGKKLLKRGVKGLLRLRGRAAGVRHHRRMNPGNVRALRRSMRRVQSFAKLARKTITFVHHVKMKKQRRR